MCSLDSRMPPPAGCRRLPLRARAQDDVTGFCMSQRMATWAGVRPASFATASSAATIARLRSLTRALFDVRRRL
jgi:hypothetical protein